MKKSIIIAFCLFSLVPLSAQRMDDVAVHSQYIQAVDEYRPAPGQYINDIPEYEAGDTEHQDTPACRSAAVRFHGRGSPIPAPRVR